MLALVVVGRSAIWTVVREIAAVGVGGAYSLVPFVGSAALAGAGGVTGIGSASLATACAGVVFSGADGGGPVHKQGKEGRWRDVVVVVGIVGIWADGVAAEVGAPNTRYGNRSGETQNRT